MELTAVAGQPYTVPCNTTVNDDVRWFFKSVHGFWHVYEFGRVQDAFISRFSLNTSVRGLDISKVQLNDTGNYTCVDKNGQGDHHIYHLTVHGKWQANTRLTKLYLWRLRVHAVSRLQGCVLVLATTVLLHRAMSLITDIISGGFVTFLLSRLLKLVKQGLVHLNSRNPSVHGQCPQTAVCLPVSAKLVLYACDIFSVFIVFHAVLFILLVSILR